MSTYRHNEKLTVLFDRRVYNTLKYKYIYVVRVHLLLFAIYSMWRVFKYKVYKVIKIDSYTRICFVLIVISFKEYVTFVLKKKTIKISVMILMYLCRCIVMRTIRFIYTINTYLIIGTHGKFAG